MRSPFQTISQERRRRLESRVANGAESPAEFDAALAPLPAPQQAELSRAYTFAAAADYHHPGLTPASYLAHPVRVMATALGIQEPSDQQAGILSLLHNMYEVSNVGQADVAAAFGAPMADAITVLTVDRTDTSRAYVEGYYARITSAPHFVRLVKVLDKFDNLFLLGLNPDAEVRSTYLSDVDTFVIPLARSLDPDIAGPLVPYLNDLVSECRTTGAFTVEDLL